jgi:hypothetical protein
MNSRNLYQLLVGLLLVGATFDAIVIPVIRLSIADCVLAFSLIAFGFSRDTPRRFTYFLFWIAPIILIGNAAIFFFYEASKVGRGFDLALLITGFIRPFTFVLIAIGFYGQLEKWQFSSKDIASAVVWAGCLLSLVVLLQYIGLFPSMFHNNPSFGETGRFTIFAEGWRPTGLSNEASFVGIFLFLLFAYVACSKANTPGTQKSPVQWPELVIFAGCFFTTSRLALLLAAIFLILQNPSFKKGVLIAIIGVTVLPFLDLSRFGNVFVFDGDASTIERYGSFFAYVAALADPATLFGTGYLNSGTAVLPYIDPLVIQVLGDRQLPAFSLPLQLLVEIGPLFCSFGLFYCVLKWRHHFRDQRLYAVIVTSLLTGIQNFIFIYIFVALVIYDRYTRSTQTDRRSGTYSEAP